MPLPQEIITADMQSFVTYLFDSLTERPAFFELDISGIYSMFVSMYYPLSIHHQTELDDRVMKEIMTRFYEYETVLSVHPNFKILTHKGTYYKMDKESESGYFVTSKTWYIVEECKDNWEMYPTHQRTILQNKGITRIYE